MCKILVQDSYLGMLFENPNLIWKSEMENCVGFSDVDWTEGPIDKRGFAKQLCILSIGWILESCYR